MAEGPYRQSGYRNDEGDPIEHFDATAWPEPQQWHPAISLGAHPVPDFPLLMPNGAGVARNYAAAVDILTADDGTPVADFGAVIPGRPEVEFLRGEPGRTVMLRAGYNLRADGRVDTGKTPSQNTDMSFPYTQADGPQRYQAAVHLGFRYLEMPGVEIARTSARSAHVVVHADHPEEGSFQQLRPHVGCRVFRLLRDSALYGVQEQFVDTPTREKGQFLGDAVNISYATMALFGERHFTAKALREFGWSARRYWIRRDERGRYNAVYPNGDGKRDIPDFSLMMPEWVEDYHRLSRDLALGRPSCSPHLQDTADYALRHIPDGRPDGRDWSPNWAAAAGPTSTASWTGRLPAASATTWTARRSTTVNAQAWSALDVHQPALRRRRPSGTQPSVRRGGGIAGGAHQHPAAGGRRDGGRTARRRHAQPQCLPACDVFPAVPGHH